MKKPRRPRWSADANILARVVTGVLPTPEGLLERQRMVEFQAIEAFAKGYATPDDFRTLCDVLNVAETMARNGIGHEVLPVCADVEAELMEAKARHDRTGSLTLTAAGLKGLRDLAEYHELQRTAIDWQTYAKMIDKTSNRIRYAHPDVKELT